MDLKGVQPGTVIDRYTVEDIIGHGGMALVMRVRHNQLGTTHALKVLTISSPSIRDRLVQEGRLQASLRHPNVLSVTDLVTLSNGSPGLIMELVEGPSLEGLLLKCRLSLEQADVIARGVLEGVAEAHRLGLVHRDLKPANILLEPGHGTYVPKVADFGLAKVLAGEPARGHTRTGSTMGTPQYMAPEQVRDTKTAGPPADVFALGAILYELVTGARAFDSPDMLEIFNAVAEGRYTPVRELAPDVPGEMVEAIRAALQVDIAARPPTVEALRDLWTRERVLPTSFSAFPEVARVVSLTTSHESWSAGVATLDQPPAPAPSTPSSSTLTRQSAVAIAGGGLLLALGGLAMLAAAGIGFGVWVWNSRPATEVVQPAVVEGTPEAVVAVEEVVSPDAPSPLAETQPTVGPKPDPAESEPEAASAQEPVKALDPAPLPDLDQLGDDAADSDLDAADSDLERRRAQVKRLAATRDRNACEQLGQVLKSESNPEIRRLAWRAVKSMLDEGVGDSKVLQEVAAWQLAHGRAPLAADAALVLGRRATRPGLLFPGLDSSSTLVQLSTLDAIGEMSQRVPDPRWWFKIKPLTRSSKARVRNKAQQVLNGL